MIITPITPIAFFNIIPHPSTLSTASPNILPTIGILLLTIAFVVFAVIPSTLLDNVPSSDIIPTNIVSITPKSHTIPELKNFAKIYKNKVYYYHKTKVQLTNLVLY